MLKSWIILPFSLSLSLYIYIYIYHHHVSLLYHHHVSLLARITLMLSHHPSLSTIAPGRSSRRHPVSAQSCYIKVLAGCPTFTRPCEGVHRSVSLMSSSLLLQQCPALGGRKDGVLPPGLVQPSSRHSCVIAIKLYLHRFS